MQSCPPGTWWQYRSHTCSGGGAAFTITLPLDAGPELTTSQYWRVGDLSSSLHGHRDCISTTQAQRRNTPMNIAPYHLVNQGHEYPCTAGTDGVSNSYRPSVHVHLVGIKAKLAHYAQRLHGKRFIELV